LKKAGAVQEIVGYGRDPAHLQTAVDLGVIDRASADLKEALAQAQIIVLAVPVGITENILRAMQPHLQESSVITDVGSSKGAVVEAARRVFGEVPPRFVPGHPIAGTEKSGVEASVDDLYEGRRVILTPMDNTDSQALQAVRDMWLQTGAQVVQTSVEHHDEVLAATSHLPHMLAFALVDTLATMDDKAEIFEFAAGGFRDFTRIASSDPQMWHDICVTNKSSIVQMLDRFMADLETLRNAINSGDSEYLLQVFQRAKHARDQFCKDL
jgi:prephenate dehydrogenase